MFPVSGFLDKLSDSTNSLLEKYPFTVIKLFLRVEILFLIDFDL